MCGRRSNSKVVDNTMPESMKFQKLFFSTKSKCLFNSNIILGPSADEEEKKSWLSYSSSPYDQVADYMAQTFRLRSDELMKTDDLSVTLSQWPRLIDTPGMVIFIIYNIFYLSKKKLLSNRLIKILLYDILAQVKLCFTCGTQFRSKFGSLQKMQKQTLVGKLELSTILMIGLQVNSDYILALYKII